MTVISRIIGLKAAAAIVALLPSLPVSAEESFLFPAESVSAWSSGEVARPSGYIWTDPISLGIPASGDAQIQAYLVGVITTQARFLNVTMQASVEHNFWIFTDRQFATDFLGGEGRSFFEHYQLAPDAAQTAFDRVVDMVSTTGCGVYPVPNSKGQLKLLLAVNFNPFQTVEFLNCSEFIALEGFGAYISNAHFDRAAAFRFLFKTYSAADRNNPFESIPVFSAEADVPSPK